MELDWSLSEIDYRTMKTCAVETGRLMAQYDVGRLRIVDWLLDGATPTLDQLAGGNHHMGTTRMSADPRTGVVDGNCRVHSLDNLYIGGSSVFATSGHANPTYTITQLALRLGDHLADRLKAA
jgi:choline dehydrogenase-like flavoprotein